VAKTPRKRHRRNDGTEPENPRTRAPLRPRPRTRNLLSYAKDGDRIMHTNRSTLNELRRAQSDAKKEWERAVQAVRVANEEVHKAHRKYVEALNALQDALARPNGKPLLTRQNEKPMVAKAS